MSMPTFSPPLKGTFGQTEFASDRRIPCLDQSGFLVAGIPAADVANAPPWHRIEVSVARQPARAGHPQFPFGMFGISPSDRGSLPEHSAPSLTTWPRSKK